MAAKYELSDDSVVVVIGSGAGGGTLSNELAQKGVKVVLLEAGGRHEIEDFSNDEWGMFGQISWLDKRTTSGTWRVAKDFAVPAYVEEGKTRLTIAIGCTGGYHRSIVLSEVLAEWLREREFGPVTVFHRELDRT